MIIKGFIKTSLIDYPGHVASTLFTSGCNFRCPYCHNRDLALLEDDNRSCNQGYTLFDPEEILLHLEKRKRVLDGVCISGGEPTLQLDLIDFIKKIKNLGLKVKLDTNGSQPWVLKQLFDQQLVDYVAMDIKNAPESYSRTSGVYVDYTFIKASIELIQQSGVPHEFRTTVVKEFHTADDIFAIAHTLNQTDHYYLQQFRPCSSQIKEGFSAYEDATLKDWQDQLTSHSKNCGLRGLTA